MKHYIRSFSMNPFYYRILAFLVIITTFIFILCATYNLILTKEVAEVIKSNLHANEKYSNQSSTQPKANPFPSYHVPLNDLLNALEKNLLKANQMRHRLNGVQDNKYVIKAAQKQPMQSHRWMNANNYSGLLQILKRVKRDSFDYEDPLSELEESQRTWRMLRSKYSRCKKSNDPNKSSCTSVYTEIREMFDEFSAKLYEMKRLLEDNGILTTTPAPTVLKNANGEEKLNIDVAVANTENISSTLGVTNPEISTPDSVNVEEESITQSDVSIGLAKSLVFVTDSPKIDTTTKIETPVPLTLTSTEGPLLKEMESHDTPASEQATTAFGTTASIEDFNLADNDIMTNETSALEVGLQKEETLEVGLHGKINDTEDADVVQLRDDHHPPVHDHLQGEVSEKHNIFSDVVGYPLPFHVEFGNNELDGENIQHQSVHGTSEGSDDYVVGQEENPSAIDASGPFMQLCEKLRKKTSSHSTKNTVAPHSTVGSPSTQFTSRTSTSIPVTGETMKASAQVWYNPGFGVMQVPSCVNPTGQVAGGLRLPSNNQLIMPSSNYGVGGMPGFYPVNQAGFMYVPMAVPNMQHGGFPGQYFTGAGSVLSQPARSPQPQNQPCPYASAVNTPAMHGTIQASFRGDEPIVHSPLSATEDSKDNIPLDTDIIYSIYGRQTHPLLNSTDRNANHNCPANQIKCSGTNECVPRESWCDSKVDCTDASDEISCTCKSRLPRAKICDGYADCPMAEDELGCFGCDKFQLTCYNDREEFARAHQSTMSMCYNMNEKCDGSAQCLNSKDEQDCNMIVGFLGHHLTYTTSFTEGILHRNYKGKWYPVCDHPLAWARQACATEVGHLDSDPFVSHVPGNIPGQFIQPRPSKHGLVDVEPPIIIDSCPPSVGTETTTMTYVKCPPMKCGKAKKKNTPAAMMHRFRRTTGGDESAEPELRVVGGRPCEPMQYPFIVALYKNGHYHCGGVIFDEHWIISAAHCFPDAEKNYFEARIGLLRRFSYSPMVQTMRITHVVIHDKYERRTMVNDLAMIRTEEPMRFNRWVRPICMPDVGQAAGDSEWVWGPREGTLCTAVGWGALKEDGASPDELQQVRVPIQPCKHSADIQGGNICAGDLSGGRDACQGDSGGPFICKNNADPDQWYLAGVVSHGMGCARPDEPGVYTRVSIFLDWIDDIVHSKNLNFQRPKLECPGFMCLWGGSFCIPKHHQCDKMVNCLGGEDEANCGLVSFHRNVSEVAEEDHVLSTTPLSIQTTPYMKTTNEMPVMEEMPTTQATMKLATNESLPKVSTIRGSEMVEEPSGSVKELHHDLNKTANESLVFQCRMIPQQIGINLRCDKTRDCEDGTDEDNCSCREYMRGKDKAMICDGRIDCYDSSDEEGCGCDPADYRCPVSRLCVKQSVRCDEAIDCPFKEDELDCVALTSGRALQLDDTFRPSLQAKGFFTRNKNGVWQVVCDEEINLRTVAGKTAGEVCTLLGFRGYKKFNLTAVSNESLHNWPVKVSLAHVRKHRYIRKHLMARDPLSFASNDEAKEFDDASPPGRSLQMQFREEVIGGEEKVSVSSKTCTALFIECEPYTGGKYTVNRIEQPTSQTDEVANGHETAQVDEDHLGVNGSTSLGRLFNGTADSNQYEEYRNKLLSTLFGVPWSVQIFANGSFRCVGFLVDNSWVAVDYKCVGKARLDTDYLIGYFADFGSMLGSGPDDDHRKRTDVIPFTKTYPKISRIDCLQLAKKEGLTLLHLASAIHFNRRILPAKPVKHKANDELNCISVSWGRDVPTLFNTVTEIRENPMCSQDNFTCFELPRDERNYTQYVNTSASNTRIRGLIACRQNEIGWYPRGFFTTTVDKYNANNLIPIQTLEDSFPQIQKIIEESTQCLDSFPPPPCHTHRCTLGKCLGERQICDGRHDCKLDEGDESIERCENLSTSCHFSEMRCANGKCIPKSKFCDRVNDCQDMSDEPSECSCLTYLKTTDPRRLCDGVLNCRDKSDEEPNVCNRTESAFTYFGTASCVPKELICDGDEDCPGGADEQYCVDGKLPSMTDSRDGYRLVLQRSYGLWHTKCLNRTEPISATDIGEICSKIGQRLHATPLEKPAFRRVNYEENTDSFLTAYGEPTKFVIVNNFSELKVNNNLTIHIKSNREMAEVVEWTREDKEFCTMVEVKCF